MGFFLYDMFVEMDKMKVNEMIEMYCMYNLVNYDLFVKEFEGVFEIVKWLYE